MKEAEIRQLIENYYDIQKIRVETFNRIVSWVKENRDRIISCLSHRTVEPRIKNASHKSNESRKKVASRGKVESQWTDASQNKSKPQEIGASHKDFESQRRNAIKILENKKYSEFVKKFVLSHERSESRGVNASRKILESQSNNASRTKNEPHDKFASQQLPEAQKRNASRTGFETQGSNASQKILESQKINASHKDFESQEKCASHPSSESHGVYASPPAFETHFLNAFSSLLREIEDLIWFHNKLYETERELYGRIDRWSREHPLRKEFLNKVKGIGPILASGLIAWLCNPILKANYVSQIWGYCGLAPNQERKRGEKLSYNPHLKTFCWKIGQSFIKFPCFGRKLYEAFRKDCERKHPDWSKLHCHNWARRKVVKLFIASVWEMWREMNGLPVTEPYPIEYLGHKDKITPEKWVEKKG